MPTSANIVVVPCKWPQHVGPNNVACCWPTMLRHLHWPLKYTFSVTSDFEQSVSTWRTFKSSNRPTSASGKNDTTLGVCYTNKWWQICQSGKLNEIILGVTSKYPTCCVPNNRFLGMVQNRRMCATFPGIIYSVRICFRLRIIILIIIANLRMRLLQLFRCSLKRESSN